MATETYTPEDITLSTLSVAVLAAFPGNFTTANILSRPLPQTLYINFNVALTAPEKFTLDGIVAANKAAFVPPNPLPGIPFYGVPIFFGCDQPVAGQGEYYVTNGTSDRTNWPTLDDRTQAAVPVDGILARFAWSTESSDATTVLKILVDGLVVHTFNLTAISGVVVFANPPSVVAGSLVAVEYDSGQAPNEGTITVYLEPMSLA